jgi:hypothetical protein
MIVRNPASTKKPSFNIDILFSCEYCFKRDRRKPHNELLTLSNALSLSPKI